MKYDRMADARNVTPDLIRTQAARDAYDRLNAAVRSYVTVEEEQDNAKRTYQAAKVKYAEDLRAAGEAGADLTKIKAPLPPDLDQYRARLETFQNIAQSAAAELRDQMVASLPEAIPATLTELEEAEQKVLSALETLRTASTEFSTIERRHAFYRALEADRGRIPIGFGSTPNLHAVEEAASRVTEALARWRVSDAEARYRLESSKADPDPDELSRIVEEHRTALVAAGR